MAKYRKWMAWVGICAIALVGCGSTKMPETIEKTTISVQKEGEVTVYLVETFDKSYYDISELTSMARKEAADYNTEKQQGEKVPVSVLQVEEIAGDNVMITYEYQDAETYMDFAEGVLFYGTVQEALAEGYNLEELPLSSVKDGTLAKEGYLQQEAKEKHVLITDQKAEIYCPYGVTYISQGAVYNENGSVDTTAMNKNTVILLKK